MSDDAIGADGIDWSRTLVLDPALEFQGKTWERLTLREPSYGEVLEAKRRGDDGDMWLVHKLSGVPMQAIVLAPAHVIMEASEIIGRFLARRQLARGAS